MRGSLHIPFPAISFPAIPFPATPVPARFLPVMLLLASLWGCTSGTTISEWSCATDQPAGCFTVAEGDAMALEALKADGRPARRGVTVSRHVIPPDATDGSRRQGDLSGETCDETPGETGPSPVELAPADPSPAGSAPVDLTALVGSVVTDTVSDDGHDAATPRNTNEGANELRDPGAHDPGATASPGASSGASSGPAAVRVPERLAEVWIGPFEDASGNWHPASRLFIVITPAGWAAGGPSSAGAPPDDAGRR